MNEYSQKLTDTIVEDDVRRGYRDKTLPQNLTRLLRIQHDLNPKRVPYFERVRFTKQTLRIKKAVALHVREQYHSDLQKPDILTSEQIKQINITRGAWSAEKEKRKQDLHELTLKMMQQLYTEGFEDRGTWLSKKDEAYLRIHRALSGRKDERDVEKLSEEQAERLIGVLNRWARWSPDVQTDYTASYAEEQGGAVYDPDTDARDLLHHMPTMDGVDALDDLDDIRDKVWRFLEVSRMRKELWDLQEEEARMLADSVEQRRDTTEEVARLYYCTEVVNADGTTGGHITPKFDGIEDVPDEILQWLLMQFYWFIRGTPDPEAAEDFLRQWGFIPAPTTTDSSSDASDESLAEPNSSVDSPPSGATDSASSASLAGTN